MTDINDAPEVHVAGIVQTKTGGHEQALSIDVTHSGALIVDPYGSVRLIPWENIVEVTFHDDSAFQPQASVEKTDEPASIIPTGLGGSFPLPKGHEGSE